MRRRRREIATGSGCGGGDGGRDANADDDDDDSNPDDNDNDNNDDAEATRTISTTTKTPTTRSRQERHRSDNNDKLQQRGLRCRRGAYGVDVAFFAPKHLLFLGELHRAHLRQLLVSPLPTPHRALTTPLILQAGDVDLEVGFKGVGRRPRK
eukprot:1088565-Rhodomonas_salina.2